MPQPGFIGSSYRRGGLLFIGKNPGNDRGEHMSPADSEQFGLINRFKEAQGAERDECFRSLMMRLETSVMPQWMITRKVVAPILNALSLDLNQAAYINLVKFHTQGTTLHKSLFEKSWGATERQITELEPSVIVVLGLSTWEQFKRYQGTARRYPITRANGDTRLPKPSEVVELAEFERDFLRGKYGSGALGV